MNKLSREERTRVVAALVEGTSIRATVRMTGAAKNTVVKLLAELGAVCRAHHNAHVRGLQLKRLQCDEIWSFCYAKEKNVPREKKGERGFGDVWTFTGIDPDSKLIVSYLVGNRDGWSALDFMQDAAARIASKRIQLTTDGFNGYLAASGAAFGDRIDFAQLVKIYGLPAGADKRYSPPECIGVHLQTIAGAPERKHISTSFVERQNLTMRMQMRRFTRLTNAFSKKIENLEHAIALHFMHYNFCRIHQTIRVTPAMKAGLADHVWTLGELVGLLEATEKKSA